MPAPSRDLGNPVAVPVALSNTITETGLVVGDGSGVLKSTTRTEGHKDCGKRALKALKLLLTGQIHLVKLRSAFKAWAEVIYVCVCACACMHVFTRACACEVSVARLRFPRLHFRRHVPVL